MKFESKLVQAGECCLNQSCEDYGQKSKGNIRKFGYTKQNRQRYQCKTCRRTHSERTGTALNGLRTEEEKIIQSLYLLARGNRIVTVARAQNVKEDTVTSWLKRAGVHAQQIEKILLDKYDLGPSEVDGLWTYVRHKGEKKSS